MNTNRMKIEIGDHALVRYIERHYLLSLDPMRKEMEEAVMAAVAVGATAFNYDNVTFTIAHAPGGKSAKVVTVLDRKMKNRKFQRPVAIPAEVPFQ